MSDQAARKRENEVSKAAMKFAKDVKNSLLFQYNWGAMLSSAPLCVSLMGSCYAAAACPRAQGMSLDIANMNWSGAKLRYAIYYPIRRFGKIDCFLGALISRLA